MNDKDRYFLDSVRQRLEGVERVVSEIKTNDLPHLKKAVNHLTGKMSVLQPFVIGIAVGIVILVIGVAISIWG